MVNILSHNNKNDCLLLIVTIENRFEFLITERWLEQRKHLQRHLVFLQLVLRRLIIRRLSLL